MKLHARLRHRQHADDAELWPGSAWRTGAGRDAPQPLVYVDHAGALTTHGLQAPMTIASPTDGDVFLAYLEQVLCPQLQPGQVVIMDNLSAHKVQGVRGAD